jgi:hypothetical protein
LRRCGVATFEEDLSLVGDGEPVDEAFEVHGHDTFGDSVGGHASPQLGEPLALEFDVVLLGEFTAPLSGVALFDDELAGVVAVYGWAADVVVDDWDAAAGVTVESSDCVWRVW